MTLKERITGFHTLGYDYWVFFLFILFMGRGTDFLSNFDPRVFPLSFLLLITLAFSMMKRTMVSSGYFNKMVILVPFLIWMAYHYFVDKPFAYVIYLIFFVKLVIGISAAPYYGARVIDYYSRIVALLAAVSIPFWVVANFIGVDTLASFAPFQQSQGEGSSFIVYTTLENLGVSDRAQALYGGITRNSGFAWEPGRFASMIVLAQVCYIIREGKINWKSREWIVLLIALLTSQSTTGYASFLLCLALYYLGSRKISSTYRILGIIGFLVIVPYILSLPFMQDKIIDSADTSNWYTEINADWIQKTDRIVTVDRTEGLYLDYLNLTYKPIMGTGLAMRETYLYKFISQNLTTSNGLLGPLSKLGLLLGVPFFILFFIGARKMSKCYSNSNTAMLFIVMIVFQYSYNFMFEIVIIAIAMYALVKEENKVFIEKI